MSIERKELHHLVDALPDKEFSAAKRFLEFLVTIHDSEFVSAEDWASIQRGLSEIKAGDVISWVDLRKDLQE